ncbi:hypothetical protein DYB38_008385 [Aphanomyces astaci]|uniref:Serine protease n=1 Tax=Aphanomyces astaci TaxID=112090 RepID=A0A397DGQ9_APHAT|nr:hypothetical protein DYB38_008385 [Aphanomyces astaci]
MNLKGILSTLSVLALACTGEAEMSSGGKLVGRSAHGPHSNHQSDVTGKVYKAESPIKIGDKVKQSIKHKAGKSATFTIPFKGPFVQVHFSDFSLPDGDSIKLSTSAKHHQLIKAGKLGSDRLSKRLGTGSSSLTVEYISGGLHHTRDYKGFAIDYILHAPKKPAKKEDVCGAKPAWEPAQCLAKKDQVKYTLSKATARMVIQGGQGAGTGFLIGCDGWFLTNEHNIETQAATTAASYEFGAECACDDTANNAKTMGCPGKLKFTGDAVLHAVDKTLDYTLVQFDKKHWPALDAFGYMTLRRSGADLGENMWMPQYPQAHPLQIVQRLENHTTTTITSLNVENECGKGQVGYFADTMGGSSGAPVVGSSDNQVIALHHCGGCQNVAYSTKKILDHVELEFKKKKMSLPTCWTHAKTAAGLAGDSDAKKRRSGDGGKKQTIDLSALFPPAKQPTTGGGEAPSRAALTSEDHAEATKKHHVQNPPLTGDVDDPPPTAQRRATGKKRGPKKRGQRTSGGGDGKARGHLIELVEPDDVSVGVAAPPPRRAPKHPPAGGGRQRSQERRGRAALLPPQRRQAPPAPELYQVNVCKAATYAVDAPPCSETGDACPKAYAEPIGGCYPGVINSPTGCVVPEDAICMQAPSPKDGGSIYYKCVFPSVGC